MLPSCIIVGDQLSYGVSQLFNVCTVRSSSLPSFSNRNSDSSAIRGWGKVNPVSDFEERKYTIMEAGAIASSEDACCTISEYSLG